MRLCWLPRPGDLLPWNSLENANGMSSLWRFNIFPGITFFCGHWPIDSWPHNILCVMVFLGHLKQSAVTSQQNEMKWNGMKEKVQQININIVIMKHWAKNEEEKPKSAARKENISFYHNGCECARTEIAMDGEGTGTEVESGCGSGDRVLGLGLPSPASCQIKQKISRLE